MNMIDEIKRDREAGTQGPWSAFTDDTAPHTNIVSPVPHTSCVFSLAGRDKRHPDIERLCRVPQMEAALIAAEKMANGSEGNIESDGVVYAQIPVALIDAFRAATGAA